MPKAKSASPLKRMPILISRDLEKAKRLHQSRIVQLLETKKQVVHDLNSGAGSPNYGARIKLLEANKKLFRREEFSELLWQLILEAASKGEINEHSSIVRKYAPFFGRTNQLVDAVKDYQRKLTPYSGRWIRV